MTHEFLKAVDRFRTDLELEIARTPTSNKRERLTELNIACMRIQDGDFTNPIKELAVGLGLADGN